MNTSLWESRDFPVLKALAEREGDSYVFPTEIADATGLETQQADLGLRALLDAGYVVTTNVIHLQGKIERMVDPRPSPAARRILHQWPPDDAFEALMRVLDRRISESTEPEVGLTA